MRCLSFCYRSSRMVCETKQENREGGEGDAVGEAVFDAKFKMQTLASSSLVTANVLAI